MAFEMWEASADNSVPELPEYTPWTGESQLNELFPNSAVPGHRDPMVSGPISRRLTPSVSLKRRPPSCVGVD